MSSTQQHVYVTSAHIHELSSADDDVELKDGVDDADPLAGASGSAAAASGGGQPGGSGCRRRLPARCGKLCGNSLPFDAPGGTPRSPRIAVAASVASASSTRFLSLSSHPRPGRSCAVANGFVAKACPSRTTCRHARSRARAARRARQRACTSRAAASTTASDRCARLSSASSSACQNKREAISLTPSCAVATRPSLAIFICARPPQRELDRSRVCDTMHTL